MVALLVVVVVGGSLGESSLTVLTASTSDGQSSGAKGLPVALGI